MLEPTKIRNDMKEVFELVSDLIYLHHPITMQIRWELCRLLSILDGRGDRCWDSREEWENAVLTYHYTLEDVLSILKDESRTRENVIRVLSAERDKLLQNIDQFDCWCKACHTANLFKDLKPEHLCPHCGAAIEIKLYANIDDKP